MFILEALDEEAVLVVSDYYTAVVYPCRCGSKRARIIDVGKSVLEHHKALYLSAIFDKKATHYGAIIINSFYSESGTLWKRDHPKLAIR
jgi:hypothetical protein